MQQQPIATPHHLDAMGDKTAGFVLARIDLEILFGAVEAEQDFGDGAVALAAQAGVERAQREDMKLAELFGHGAEVTPRSMPLERAHQSAGGVRTQIVEVISRQDRGIESRRVGDGLRQPELVRDAIGLPDAVPAIGGLAQIEAVEMRQRDDRLGSAVVMLHGREPYGPWLKAWGPEQGLPI